MLQSELMVGIAVCCESDYPLPTPRSLVGFDRRNADQIRRHPLWHYSGKIDSSMNHFRALFLWTNTSNPHCTQPSLHSFLQTPTTHPHSLYKSYFINPYTCLPTTPIIHRFSFLLFHITPLQFNRHSFHFDCFIDRSVISIHFTFHIDTPTINSFDILYTLSILLPSVFIFIYKYTSITRTPKDTTSLIHTHVIHILTTFISIRHSHSFIHYITRVEFFSFPIDWYRIWFPLLTYIILIIIHSFTFIPFFHHLSSHYYTTHFFLWFYTPFTCFTSTNVPTTYRTLSIQSFLSYSLHHLSRFSHYQLDSHKYIEFLDYQTILDFLSIYSLFSIVENEWEYSYQLNSILSTINTSNINTSITVTNHHQITLPFMILYNCCMRFILFNDGI